jgi:AraC-like DNA-binding protein
MSADVTVDVQFFLAPPDLRQYLTAFCLINFTAPEGAMIHDALLPEWGNLRFFHGVAPEAWIGSGDRLSGTHFVATGPSTSCVHFSQGTTRLWGVGLLPLGWAQFVRAPAADLANRLVDGTTHPAFAHFSTLLTSLHEHPFNVEAELARFIAFFRNMNRRPPRDLRRIETIHAAMLDAGVASVADLSDRVGAGLRTIERTTHSAFGFSPKILLRRQRLMRSLARFILDPTRKWTEAMDQHYTDQPQFIRDFHDFIGMTPREYAAMPHPMVIPFIKARAQFFGDALQTMHVPTESD